MAPAITVEKLSKEYHISEGTQGGYRTLRESLDRFAHNAWRRLDPSNRKYHRRNSIDRFWALKDVSFDVQPGEVIGIIGRNGAGKSTILKILGRVTEPTCGRAVVRGRIGSLLEVGTGFPAELTGRENVYMSGSMLGMSRREITKKFDEIVAFAELDQFVDTPVKRYSSGMYVRLAFAVAAHLEPEVLLIDEVIAVGDAEFQRRCLSKITDIARSGRTVFFVSHSMTAIKNICTRVLLLARGQLEFSGDADHAVLEYLKCAIDMHSDRPLEAFRAPGSTPVVKQIQVLDSRKRCTHHLPAGAPASVRIEYEAAKSLSGLKLVVIFETITGDRLFSLHSAVQHSELASLCGSGMAICSMPCLPLIPGTYKLTVLCALPNVIVDQLERVLTLEVVASDFFGTGCLPKPEFGRLLVPGEWHFSRDECAPLQFPL